MKKLLYFLVPAIVLLSGCIKDEGNLDTKLVGTWQWNSFNYVDVNSAFNQSWVNIGTISFNSNGIITYVNSGITSTETYNVLNDTQFSINHPRTNGSFITVTYTVSTITESSLRYSGTIVDAVSGANGTASYVLSK